MANPLYRQLFGGGGMPATGPAPSAPNQLPPMNMNMNMNPLQKMMAAMQAMSNPIAFIKQRFPDIPANIQNDPNQVFQYLQQTRNPVSEEQIREAQQMTGQIIGQGTVR